MQRLVIEEKTAPDRPADDEIDDLLSLSEEEEDVDE